MIQPITVRVYDIVGSPLCVSAEDGQRLHSKIAPLLRADRPVSLSFDRVDTIISAFLNAAVGQLYGEFPAERVDKLLTVTDVTSDDESVLRHVVDNAKVYFKSPSEFDRAWREELGDDMDDEE